MCDWEVDVQLASGGSQSADIKKVKLLLEHDDDTVLIHEQSNDGRGKGNCFVCPATYLEDGQSPCIAVAVTNIRNLDDDISIMNHTYIIHVHHSYNVGREKRLHDFSRSGVVDDHGLKGIAAKNSEPGSSTDHYGSMGQ